MFNWTTTRIINSLQDYNNEGVRLVVYDPTAKILHVKRDLTLEAKYVKSIYKKEYAPAQTTSVTIKLADAINAMTAASGVKLGSLNFYISLDGSNESIYANDWYKKGKPFSIGFKVGSSDTTEDVIDQITKAITKHSLAMYGRNLYKITKTGTGATATMTISGTHEFQRIDEVVILDEINPGDPVIAKKWSFSEGATGLASAYTRGSNAFGSYEYITRNLRLPTATNTVPFGVGSAEAPIVGGKYTQYIVNYVAPSMANPAFNAVGELSTSETTHVFWVESSCTTDFEGVLAALKADGTSVAGSTLTAATAKANTTDTFNVGTTSYEVGTDKVPFTTDDKKA